MRQSVLGTCADNVLAAQCVWSGTNQLGMGKATADNGATYIVARYLAPGNVYGQKPY